MIDEEQDAASAPSGTTPAEAASSDAASSDVVEDAPAEEPQLHPIAREALQYLPEAVSHRGARAALEAWIKRVELEVFGAHDPGSRP